MAPSPQHGTRVRASSAAARNAARAGGDSGPARREISASESRSSVMDMDGLAWDKLAVTKVSFRFRRLGPLPPGGPFLSRVDLDFHATDAYSIGPRSHGFGFDADAIRRRRHPPPEPHELNPEPDRVSRRS